MPFAPIVIVGSGLAGYTLAREIRRRAPGMAVTIVSRDSASRMGEELEVQVLSHTSVTDIDPAGGFVWLSDGRPLAYRHLVLAWGAEPAGLDRPSWAEVAALAGLACGRGILVDRHLETTKPNIHALGDCAEMAGMAVSAILSIPQQAQALARTLTGTPTEVPDLVI